MGCPAGIFLDDAADRSRDNFCRNKIYCQPSSRRFWIWNTLSSAADTAFGRIKGIRDLFSGLALLPLLFLGMKRATAWVFTAAIIIPATDCLIILMTNGPSDIQHLLIHGIMAAYTAITSALLFGNKSLKNA
jgi:hypothetical protein